MDAATITSIGISVASIAAGWTVGRRGIAADTVNMLQAQVEVYERQKAEQDTKITALESKVEILESLVTQRAAVDEVRQIVERIADRVGA